MGIKSRNISFFAKLVCIVLSVLLMMGAFFYATRVLRAAEYFHTNGSIMDTLMSDEPKTLADCDLLSDKITDDMYYLYQKSVYDAETREEDRTVVLAYLEEQKSDFLDRAMEAFEEGHSVVVIYYDSEEEAYESEDEAYDVAETTVASYRNSYDDLFHFSYLIELNGESYLLNIEEYNMIYFTEESDSVYDQLNDTYEMFVSDHILPGYAYYDEDYYELANDLKYYVVNKDNGVKLTNMTAAPEEESILSYPYALVVKNGVPTYSEDFENVIDNYLDRETGRLALESSSHCDFVLYVDENYNSSYSHSYQALIKDYEKVASYRTKQNMTVSALLAMLSLLLAVYVVTVVGKRLKDGKVKRMWLDYIPTDLHFAVTCAAVGGLLVLLLTLLSDVYDTDYDTVVMTVVAGAATVGLIWLLLVEFMTSFIRVCRSEKGLWRNLLTVMLVKWLIVKPISALKSALTYQPANFKKQLRLAVTLYILLNFVFILAAWLAAVADNIAFLFLCILLLLGGNIAAAVFAINYIAALDKIITAAHFRTVPQVDYYKLPNSLKVLYASLSYTRQELDAAVARAVRDERVRTELITNVSHDLKTPLTSIITYVDLLKQCEVDDENAKEYIAVLDDKGKRLKRLIDDLLEASKITSGVIRLQPVMLSLNELAAQAVVERQQEFSDNRLELVFKGEEKQVTCYADGTKTFRILDNLLSNARKYSAAGTRVYYEVSETEAYAMFEIKNTSAQKLDITPQELTERFVRGDRSRNTEGSGLGLSIAENLCKAQNGKLNITIDGDLFKAQVMLPKHK